MITIDNITITDKNLIHAYNSFMSIPLEGKINIVALNLGLSEGYLKRNYTIGQINTLFQTCVIKPFVEKVLNDRADEASVS